MPPIPYAAGDIIWSTKDGDHLPASQTNASADRFGIRPGDGREGRGGYYGPNAFGKVFAERVRKEAATKRAQGGS